MPYFPKRIRSVDRSLVKDIYPGSPSSDLRDLVVLNNKLLFTANDGTSGQELWLYDPALPLSPKRSIASEYRRTELFLSRNYPNPFPSGGGSPTTTIAYDIPADAMVSLKVYDLHGRDVQTLVEEMQWAGRHSRTFSAGDLPGGTYFYRIESGGATRRGMMTFVR